MSDLDNVVVVDDVVMHCSIRNVEFGGINLSLLFLLWGSVTQLSALVGSDASQAKKLGITDVPAEVVTFISHATQSRLRTVIEKVTVITQHRMESYKDDEWYEQATDVRAQLKFFEQLERLEKQRKDEQEREILLKAAKSRSRQEDPEQARLKQKAKEMQQQELAQMRQRDANLTALAAIGPRKKRKLDTPGLLSMGGEISAGELAELGTEVDLVYILNLT
ncbi:transcription initiation factor TFIID subunit 4-like protein [Pitangus sulphuratus]|nr:transcription initiation factor TFIID subunit 4-like protein [Pitangus sulphuratus]